VRRDRRPPRPIGHLIKVDGLSVGSAVPLPSCGGYRFIASDGRVEELDSTIWPDLQRIETFAAALLRTGRMPPPRIAAALFDDRVHRTWFDALLFRRRTTPRSPIRPRAR